MKIVASIRADFIFYFLLMVSLACSTAVSAQLIAPPRIDKPVVPAPGPGSDGVGKEENAASLTGGWEGEWGNTDGKRNTFIFIIRADTPNHAIAVGTAKHWTTWELFEGTLEGDLWTFAGVKVLKNKAPVSNYSLDVLTFALSNEGKKLEGTWKDVDGDTGTVSISRRTTRIPSPTQLEEMGLGALAVKSQPIPNDPWADAELTLRRFGPIEFGMTVEQAEAALGQQLVADEVPRDSACYMFSPKSGPEDIRFMVLEGRIVRVDIRTKSFATKSGARLGDKASHIFSLYGDRIQTSPHTYEEEGRYLTYVPKDGEDQNYRLIFDEVKGVVVLLRAGILPGVAFVEGCL